MKDKKGEKMARANKHSYCLQHAVPIASHVLKATTALSWRQAHTRDKDYLSHHIAMVLVGWVIAEASTLAVRRSRYLGWQFG